jgi:hypothetical protein
MITPPEYTVMGEDGKEYGPVSEDQIRQWIAEGRAGSKTPVKTPRDRDWVFLNQVPEFAEFFAAKPARLPRPGPRKGLINAVLLIAVITALYYLFSYLLSLKKH